MEQQWVLLLFLESLVQMQGIHQDKSCQVSGIHQRIPNTAVQIASDITYVHYYYYAFCSYTYLQQVCHNFCHRKRWALEAIGIRMYPRHSYPVLSHLLHMDIR